MKIRNPFNENFTGFKKDATGWEKFGWGSFLASLGGALYEFPLGSSINFSDFFQTTGTYSSLSSTIHFTKITSY